MLKKTIAFGIFAASTIGLAIPAQAQTVQQNSQTVQSTTVGANGSHVFSGNLQTVENAIYDNNLGYGHYYEEPNLQGNHQGIGSSTVGANASSSVSENVQSAENTIIDSDALWMPYLIY